MFRLSLSCRRVPALNAAKIGSIDDEIDSRNGPFKACCNACPDFLALSLKGVATFGSWKCCCTGAGGNCGGESVGAGVTRSWRKTGGEEGINDTLASLADRWRPDVGFVFEGGAGEEPSPGRLLLVRESTEIMLNSSLSIIVASPGA